ncbi:hypothetical protein GCM10025864_33510 [Luteimicrobium album]|uniref:Choice-of-anchor G family protein n=1 Tax=Luteimicrobium album TaxID=1054550 RepID=A0ABQ6I5V3_9MICO|nr:choice-of-anchor G family protein [Luteimicrobium album]GMA25592.1 hypothetical protein GCM10025864_33510 [Luteimicrobium album]
MDSQRKASHWLAVRTTRARTVRRGVALAATSVIIGAVSLTALPATAAPTDVSEAYGRLLSGSALTLDLDTVAALDGATAENPSGTHPTDGPSNLDASAVADLLTLQTNGVNLFGNNGIVKLGVGGQYAEAKDDGSAYASSGAITDTGAIAVGGSAARPSDATITLDALLSNVPVVSTALDKLSVDLGAISASATATPGPPPPAHTRSPTASSPLTRP